MPIANPPERIHDVPTTSFQCQSSISIFYLVELIESENEHRMQSVALLARSATKMKKT